MQNAYAGKPALGRSPFFSVETSRDIFTRGQLYSCACPSIFEIPKKLITGKAGTQFSPDGFYFLTMGLTPGVS